MSIGGGGASGLVVITYQPITAPTVIGLSPNQGPSAGGTTTTITGTMFINVTAVHFGLTSVSFTVLSTTSIAVTSPLGTGKVDVTVTNTMGTSPTSSSDIYTYGDDDYTSLFMAFAL